MRSIIFKLELSEYFKAHLIVYITLLKSVSDNTRLIKIINVKKYKNQDYVVKKILEKNQIDETDHYFVKWKNYDNNENIWKSIEHLEKTQQMLKSFLQHWDLLRNHQTMQKK